ncbi:MAG: hypothetical protein NVS1B7_0600 [Candidatus Saccharimonadales bacterium]
MIVFIVIGLVGASGWLIYMRQIYSKNNMPISSIPLSGHLGPTSKTQELPKYSLTTRLTSINKKFAINVPDGWIMTNDIETDYAYSTGITYKQGEAAKVNNERGYRGGGFTRTSFSIQYAKDGFKGYYSSSISDGVLKLNNGKQAKKYSGVITNDQMGTPDGSKFYGYQIDYESGSIIINYLVNPSDKDERTLIEASIKTISL